jgi:hypothetical protein
MDNALIVPVFLFVLFLIGALVDIRCHIRSKKIQDEIDRETLGKKYYEELWGKGTWENGK